MTIVPSRTMNCTWLFACLPPKPPLSSTERKTVRMKRQVVAVPRAVDAMISRGVTEMDWGDAQIRNQLKRRLL